MKRVELDLELQPVRGAGDMLAPAVPGHDAPVRFGHIADALRKTHACDDGDDDDDDGDAAGGGASDGDDGGAPQPDSSARPRPMSPSTAAAADYEVKRAASLDRASQRHSRRRRKQYPERGLGMLQSHPLRRRAIEIVDDAAFDQAVITLILVNCVFLALWNPIESPCSAKNAVLDQAEFVFLLLFSVEMGLKLVAMGVHGGQHRLGYLGDRWNWLDAVVVLSGWLSLVLDALTARTCGDGAGDSSVSAIRVVRMLRPLRAINGIPGLKRIIAALIGAVPQLMNVMIMCTFIFLIFGLLGLQLFRGRMQQRCYRDAPRVRSDAAGQGGSGGGSSSADQGWAALPAGATLANAPWWNMTRQWEWDAGAEGSAGALCSKSASVGRQCAAGWTCGDSGISPNGSVTSFDNIGWAFLTIFQCITLEGWTDVMYDGGDDRSLLTSAFFLVLLPAHHSPSTCFPTLTFSTCCCCQLGTTCAAL